MIDNFKLISDILDTHEITSDTFYHLQIIKRRKENEDLATNHTIVHTYQVTSIQHLAELRDEIIVMCNAHNARAYFNLNPRSFRKVAHLTMAKSIDLMEQGEYSAVAKAYESVCKKHQTGLHKSCIIDIDNHDEEFDRSVQKALALCDPKGAKIIANVPTKNGHHIISSPFNIAQLKQQFPTLDIHKNSPTVLYVL